MRILGTLADASACGWYRMTLPFAELTVGRGQEAHTTMQLPIDPEDPIYDVDLMVVQRIADPNIAGFLKDEWVGKKGKPYIFELDDLVHHLHRSNTMAWDYYGQEGRLSVLADTMRHAAAITTTTDVLAEELSVYNERVYVLPNSLPNWVMALNRPERPGPVRIVYTGGPSHLEDVQLYRYGIGHTIKQLGEKVELHTYGHPWLKELGLTDEAHAKVRPWTLDFATYQSTLCDYDIGLAPLKNTRFNRSKSAIKVMEYWAAGVVPIASDVVPYSPMINDGVDGFLCRTDNDWRKAIQTLVNEPDTLRAMRKAGADRVPELVIEANVDKWLDCYVEVLG